MGIRRIQRNQQFSFQVKLLANEIDYIHGIIKSYDDISFKIKGWAVTIWSAVVVFGVKEKVPLVIILSLPALVGFWVLDAIFKQYQRRSMIRMGVIERFLDSSDFSQNMRLAVAFEKEDFQGFPIHDPIANRTKELNETIKNRYQSKTDFWKCLWTPNIYYLYLLLGLSAIIVAFFV